MVIVYDRNHIKRLQFEPDSFETVMDVKHKLCHENPKSLCLTYQGKLLDDAMPLSMLESEAILFLENDIEFTKIEMTGEFFEADTGVEFINTTAAPDQPRGEKGHRVSELLGKTAEQKVYQKINYRGEDRIVKCTDLFVLNGKTYLITKRKRRISMRYLQEKLESLLTPAMIFQLLILMFILHTNNIFLLIVILSIRILRLLSKIFHTKQVWRGITNHAAKSVFMFVASVFLIDHTSFYLDGHAESHA